MRVGERAVERAGEGVDKIKLVMTSEHGESYLFVIGRITFSYVQNEKSSICDVLMFMVHYLSPMFMDKVMSTISYPVIRISWFRGWPSYSFCLLHFRNREHADNAFYTAQLTTLLDFVRKLKNFSVIIKQR